MEKYDFQFSFEASDFIDELFSGRWVSPSAILSISDAEMNDALSTIRELVALGVLESRGHAVSHVSVNSTATEELVTTL